MIYMKKIQRHLNQSFHQIITLIPRREKDQTISFLRVHTFFSTSLDKWRKQKLGISHIHVIQYKNPYHQPQDI